MPDPTVTPPKSPSSSDSPSVLVTGSLGAFEADPSAAVAAAIAANPKSALATTELWLTVFINLSATAVQFGIIKAGGQAAVIAAFIAQAATNILYILARTQLKAKHVDGAAQVASAAAAPASSSLAIQNVTPAAQPAVTA